MSEQLISFIFLLFIFFAVNILLTKFCCKIFRSQFFYRLFVAPGIIIHELSHIIACLLSGAKIKKFSFFAKKGGYVKHLPSKIPILGQFFISFMPILGGIGAILFLSWLFQYNLFFQEIRNLGFWNNIKDLFFLALHFLEYNWQTWQFWLFTYLIISISICLMPSSQDIKNGIKGLLIIIFLVVIIFYLNLFSDFLIKGIDGVNTILIFGIISQVFGLFFCFTIFTSVKIVKFLKSKVFTILRQ